VHVGALHPFTPGHPEYGLLKVGAVGALFALRMAMVRRSKRGTAGEEHTEAAPVEETPLQRRPHPLSKKKRRRR
jgi:hypothetical protein